MLRNKRTLLIVCLAVVLLGGSVGGAAFDRPRERGSVQAKLYASTLPSESMGKARPGVQAKCASAPKSTLWLGGLIPEPVPDAGAVVPAQAEPVRDEYFDDAAFVGNSLIDGVRIFSGLTKCDFYAANSKTIFGIGDYITQMSRKEYGKIYMLLGINELGYSMSSLMDAYSDALDRLMADHPDAVIYVMGVSPVTAAKDASSSTFTMKNVRNFNEHLLQLVEEKGCCYIDLCDALAGADGFLPANVSTDGVHFVKSEYAVWMDYLRSHYVSEEVPAPRTRPSLLVLFRDPGPVTALPA